MDDASIFESYIAESLNKLCERLKAPRDSFIAEVKPPTFPNEAPKCTIRLTSRYSTESGRGCPLLLSIARDVAEKYMYISVVFSGTSHRWLAHNSSGDAVATPDELAKYLYFEIVAQLKRELNDSLQLDTDWMDILSTMRYEGARITGTIVLAHGEFPNSVANKLLTPSISVCTGNDSLILSKDNLTHVSKLMAGAGEGALLFCSEDGLNYRCLGYLPRETTEFFPFVLKINGPFDWLMSCYGRPEFRWFQGNPEVYDDHIMNISKKLCDFFSISESHRDEIEKALHAFASQRHGTSAIFVDLGDANSSVIAERFINLLNKRRALEVSGLPLKKLRELEKLSRMDGAFVIDVSKMEVVYMSVIVDGLAVVDGDNSRGARMNTLCNFIADVALISKESKKRLKAVAVVMSEDNEPCAVFSNEF